MRLGAILAVVVLQVVAPRDPAWAQLGQRPTPAYDIAAVLLTLESSTTAPKGAWAFAGPRPLHITDGSFHLQLAPASYSRRVVRSGDPQFQDAVSFTLTPEQVALAAAQPRLDLKAGNARIRLAADGMEMIREAVRRMSVPAGD